jgi:hypothetical protein
VGEISEFKIVELSKDMGNKRQWNKGEVTHPQRGK